MLVLLIIFMIAAPLATVDVAVDLPGSTAQPAPRPAEPIYLTVREDLSLALGEAPVDRAALGPALDALAEGDKEARVFLRADRARRLRRPDGGDEPAADRRLPEGGAGRPRAAAGRRRHDRAVAADEPGHRRPTCCSGAPAGAAALAAHAALAAWLLRAPPVRAERPGRAGRGDARAGADADRAARRRRRRSRPTSSTSRRCSRRRSRRPSRPTRWSRTLAPPDLCRRPTSPRRPRTCCRRST